MFRYKLTCLRLALFLGISGVIAVGMPRTGLAAEPDGTLAVRYPAIDGIGPIPTAKPAEAPPDSAALAERACWWCDPQAKPWYISLSAGWQSREIVHEIGDPATFIQWDDGFSFAGAIGRRFGKFRVEAEFSLMNNGVHITGGGIPGVGNFVSTATGNVDLRAYMFNVYHDIAVKDTPIKVYLGAGIGLYQSQINSLLPGFFSQLGMPLQGFTTTSNYPFAYQFRAGVSYTISPTVDVFVGYRYFHGNHLTFSAFPFGTFHPDGATNNNIEAGFRINF